MSDAAAISAMAARSTFSLVKVEATKAGAPTVATSALTTPASNGRPNLAQAKPTAAAMATGAMIAASCPYSVPLPAAAPRGRICYTSGECDAKEIQPSSAGAAGAGEPAARRASAGSLTGPGATAPGEPASASASVLMRHIKYGLVMLHPPGPSRTVERSR